MLNRFTEMSSKNKRILFEGLLVVLLIPLLAFLLRLTDNSAEQAPPQKFEYCQADPQDLCILSFGRDGAGNAIINFFVPEKNFPDFYLIVKKTGAESRYECKANTEIKTSVFCSGDPLSLKQTIQIDLFASRYDQWLATGTFFIEAFLVSPPSTPEASGTEPESSPTTIKTITPTASATSYPNPTGYP